MKSPVDEKRGPNIRKAQVQHATAVGGVRMLVRLHRRPWVSQDPFEYLPSSRSYGLAGRGLRGAMVACSPP
jgi:hypothetical protein